MTGKSSVQSGPSRLLVLNGAEERLQIVIGDVPANSGGVVSMLAAQEWVVPGRAMQFLVPLLQDTFARLGLTPADFRGLACTQGPGSFTGLRLVLATALGFAKGNALPLAPLPSLPLLAAGVPALSGDTVWAVTHARTRQVYLQGFRSTEPDSLFPAAISGPAAVSLEEAEQIIRRDSDKASGRVLLAGSGLRRNAAFFSEYLTDAVVLPPIYDHPRPDILLAAAASAEYSDCPVEPLYLRPSDAEENLDTIAEARGLDPEAAREKLRDLTDGKCG